VKVVDDPEQGRDGVGEPQVARVLVVLWLAFVTNSPYLLDHLLQSFDVGHGRRPGSGVGERTIIVHSYRLAVDDQPGTAFVRLAALPQPSPESEYAAITAVAHKLGVGTAETLRKWVRQAQVDAGARPGVTTEESVELKRLRREVAELRRANEILKAASAFFAAELDRPQTHS